MEGLNKSLIYSYSVHVALFDNTCKYENGSNMINYHHSMVGVNAIAQSMVPENIHISVTKKVCLSKPSHPISNNQDL